MDLSGDYDQVAVQEQKAFLKELGPYRKLASTDSMIAFLRRLKVLWFLRWPLKRARYLDFKGMEFRQNEIFKDVKKGLMWAASASTVTSAQEERGWRGHMKICEARQGIYRENKVDLFDDKQLESLKRKRLEDEAGEGSSTTINTDTVTKPRPRPRPHSYRRKRLEDEVGEGSSTAAYTDTVIKPRPRPHAYTLALIEMMKARREWKEVKADEDI